MSVPLKLTWLLVGGGGEGGGDGGGGFGGLGGRGGGEGGGNGGGGPGAGQSTHWISPTSPSPFTGVNRVQPAGTHECRSGLHRCTLVANSVWHVDCLQV